MNESFKPCGVIPVYKHCNTVLTIAQGLGNLPLLLVDDGNTADDQRKLQQIAKQLQNCRVLVLKKNLGKGGAVRSGLIWASEMGYTHVLQIDADGQHDIANVCPFLERAQQLPNYLIAGYPVFDDSVPASRKNGRKITNFWVHLETLSRDIPDAMCGFRVYPLEAILRVFSKFQTYNRMEFDIEILVKLHWLGVPMEFLPIRVIYPEDGISNFRMFRDNVRISFAHAVLFCNMLLRWPSLVVQRRK